MIRWRSTRGMVVVTVLLWLALLATAALGVALATAAEAPATGAQHDRLRLVHHYTIAPDSEPLL